MLRLGRTVGFLAGQLMDQDGRALVRATASALLVPTERLPPSAE